MESKPPKKDASDPTPIPVYVIPNPDRLEEVSLADLWSVMATRKLLILLSALAVVLASLGYLSVATPLYRAEAKLLSPQQQHIQGLLIDFQGIKSIGEKQYTPEFVYQAFLKNLKSHGVRREYFDINNLGNYFLSEQRKGDVDSNQIFDKEFDSRFQVKIDRQDASFVTVSLASSDPKLAAQWLNDFIDFANRKTAHELVSDINAAIQAEIDRVGYELVSKAKLAEQRRRDKIVALQEALRVAGALGINNVNIYTQPEDKGQTAVTVNASELPLYMRGTAALETEIEVLESRKSDAPFIEGLRDLQERKAFLEDITIDPDSLSTVIVDTVARIPYRAERPRKLLITASAAVLGVVLGIFLAFFLEFSSKTRPELKNPSV